MIEVDRLPRPREQMIAAIALEPVDGAMARHAAEAYEPLALTAWAHFRFMVAEASGFRHAMTPEQLMYLPELHTSSRFLQGGVIGNVP